MLSRHESSNTDKHNLKISSQQVKDPQIREQPLMQQKIRKKNTCTLKAPSKRRPRLGNSLSH